MFCSHLSVLINFQKKGKLSFYGVFCNHDLADEYQDYSRHYHYDIYDHCRFKHLGLILQMLNINRFCAQCLQGDKYCRQYFYTRSKCCTNISKGKNSFAVVAPRVTLQINLSSAQSVPSRSQTLQMF